MATKFFCDICQKEKLKADLALFRLTHIENKNHGPWAADVCQSCSDKLLKQFKELRTTSNLL
jgi:hypothetical protein